MKNYRKSDYAFNKYSYNIVYNFAGETVEITLEKYLLENPDKSAEDFYFFKSISDTIYLELDRLDHLQTKKNVSIHNITESSIVDMSIDVEDEYIDLEDRQRIWTAAKKMFEILTPKQKSRFIKYYIKGYSIRAIAKEEGVFYTSVADCLRRIRDKLREYYDNL